MQSAKKDGAIRFALAAACLLSTSLFAEDWATFGHDPQRSGWAFEESTLTPQNVNQLELKWKAQAQNEPRSLTALTAPVVASGVVTPQGVRTLVYVAGSADHLFAYDAANGKLAWRVDFDSRVLPKDEGMWLCPNGINATPVIDRRSNSIYAVAVDGRLYGLDLGTGSIRFGPAQFVPPFSKNWSLNFVDGVIYTAISQGCGGAESGIYSISVEDPERPMVRDLFISHRGGGIWGRGGPVIGKNGRVYASTGDGDYVPAKGAFSNSVIAASLDDLKLVDHYTPTNWEDVSRYDLDMGSASPVWFSSGDYDLLVAAGKEAAVYLMDANELGDKDHQTPLQTLHLANDEKAFQGKGVWGGMSAWRDLEDRTWVYVPISGPVSKDAPSFPQNNGPVPHGCIMAFKVSANSSSKKPILDPAWVSGDLNLPEPVVIANGVVFALSTGENSMQTEQSGVIVNAKHLRLLTDAERRLNTKNAVLYALDAKTGKTLYDSGDAISGWTHFSGLAVADGRIYAVDHDSRLYCFGLRNKQ
ncbi:MAG TPA: PQQ-binding-like beta-propeller repeat protein [Terriglobia bacterium]|nr:PQQ-binding-like beta-propeller repeat protein [Terriglobia bacterium]